MEANTDSRRLDRDIAAMAQSEHPVVIALAGFLQDACIMLGSEWATGADEIDLNSTLPSLRHLYMRDRHFKQLRAACDSQDVGNLSVVITEESKYYLIYFPVLNDEAEHEEVGSLYDGYTYTSSEPGRYTVDARSATVEIDATEGDMVLRPVVLIQDNHEPMRKGMINFEHYNPAHHDVMKRIVDRILSALNGEYLKINGNFYTRPRQSRQLPTF